MVRPPLALGHHGSIKVDRHDGRWVARCRFRDLDGVTRRVARWGTSKAGAQAAFQDELRQRTGQQGTEVLKPNSRFREATDVWMTKIRERRLPGQLRRQGRDLAGQRLDLHRLGADHVTQRRVGLPQPGDHVPLRGRRLDPDTSP